MVGVGHVGVRGPEARQIFSGADIRNEIGGEEEGLACQDNIRMGQGRFGGGAVMDPAADHERQIGDLAGDLTMVASVPNLGA